MTAAFTPEDLARLSEHGIGEAEAAAQLELLRKRPAPIRLDRPATAGDGIERLSEDDLARAFAAGERAAARGEVVSFVPAAGAATRMFASPRRALAGAAPVRETPDVGELLDRLGDLPFGVDVRRAAAKLRSSGDVRDRKLLSILLDEPLGYGSMPKALVPFHLSDDGRRTPLDEHLLQAPAFCADAAGRTRVHVVAPTGWQGRFESLLAESAARAARRTGAVYEIAVSEQHPATDTLALAADGAPFRDEAGSLVLRPGGHGALLRNLAASIEGGGAIVSIRNVDNVVPFERSSEIARWKRILAGRAAELRDEVFAAAEEVSTGREGALRSAASFLRRTFGVDVPKGAGRPELEDLLDRPIRVIGVVRNEGEPGGAPFWVVDGDSRVSLQIVESAELDPADPEQRRIFGTSTHFNPVDIAAVLRSRSREPFELDRFVDASAVFVAEKSHGGRPLRALERPGLWNGAMAKWNSVAVEVPAETFAPVKTVLDLLRPAHSAFRGAREPRPAPARADGPISR